MGITTYTDELGDKICEETATSTVGLKKICERLDVAYSTVTGWIYNKDHPLSEKYARAKELQADHMGNEILEIADDSSNDTIEGEYGPLENREWVNRSKIKIDTRKWLMSKILPKKYGDKIELAGDKDNPIQHIITGMEIR